MRSYSLNELFRLTRNQLLALHAETVARLAALPEDSADRPVALANLCNIRRVLATAGLSP